MLKQLWQWLKRFFQRLFSRNHSPAREQNRVEPPQQLTDAEYESLFLQLLAEVNDGLTRGGAKGFLAARRINEGDLVEWLQGFGERLFASATPNDELARRMVRLGELSIGEVSDVAGDIGRRLGGGETNRQGAEGEEGVELQAIPEVAKLFALLQQNNNFVQPSLQNLEITNIPQPKIIIPSSDIPQYTVNSAIMWLSLGVRQIRAGDFNTAITSLEKAIESNLDFHYLSEAWFFKGEALISLGLIEEAIASCEEAIKIKPNYHEAWNWLGSVLCDNLQQYEKAVNSFDKAIKLKSDFYSAWHNRAEALNKLGKFEEALASCNEVIIKIGSEFEQYYETWNKRGLALNGLQQFEEAIASYDKAIEFKGDFHQAWNNRGVALADLGRNEEAIASYDKAIEFKSDYHEAWNYRGVALGKLGRFEEAIKSFEKALKFKTDYHIAWYGRGLALYNLGQFEKAIASYDKVIKFKPDDYSAWCNRGAALDNLGQFEEAIASFDKAIEFKPDDYLAWCNWGAALDHLGQFEEAIIYFDNALKFKPDFHTAWIGRGIAAGKVAGERTNFFFTFTLPNAAAPNLALIFKNPDLNKRGYEGKLASYEEGLKHCQQDTHPEGWGELHQAIGNAHYLRGRGNYNARYFWRKAVNSYKTALQTLTATDFPELHLEVLQDLIRVLLDLDERAEATELQRQGTELWRRLLNEPNRSERSKKQLALKFAWIQQLTVDLAVQSGDLLQAIELAEEGKNTCLRWLLDGWSDEISSFSYSQIQQLLNPSTAIVYWHLSSYALHTFILKHNAPSPIVLGNTEFLTQAQRLRDFEDWVKNWNEQYTDYRKGKDKQGEKDKTWRDNLPRMLDELANILNIPAILQDLTPQPPSLQGNGESNSPRLLGEGLGERFQIILIPHRDLHRFPLHALFPPEFIISYLPSAKIGSIAVKQDNHNQKNLLSIEHPNSTGYPSLDFAEIESEAITQMFANPTRLHSEQATKAALINALPQDYNIFHFTGHGVYNFQNPALSFLALAGEEKLTLADIYGFNLQSYQLVTLAACETAITGNHTITTEYVGLVSGFMSCGVAHVVSTLWTVESAASALVMIQFYQLLQQGKPEIIALAEATQWLRNVTNAELAQWYAAQLAKLPENEGFLYRFWSRHSDKLKNNPEPSKKPYNHPYFWAAFTITGNFSS